jgi:hypothetical protein
MALPKCRDALAWLPVRPSSGGSIIIKETILYKDPGMYKEALIVATFKRALYCRASIDILLCRILYFMGSTGLLVD